MTVVRGDPRLGDPKVKQAHFGSAAGRVAIPVSGQHGTGPTGAQDVEEQCGPCMGTVTSVWAEAVQLKSTGMAPRTRYAWS